MSDLKKVAKAVAESKTAEDKLKALSQAYALFSEETSRLREAYDGLKEQFKLVTSELEESNLQLHEKVVEFGLITEYLDTILINISQGILFVDLNGVITTFNTAAEKILGVRCPVVLFDPFWDNFDDAIFGFSMREALSDRKAPKSVFVSLKHPDGKKRDLEIETTFVNETGGSASPVPPMQGLIVIIRDITEIRQLQALTQRNNRMKELGEMAASVAHEIRNPLGGIKGFASLLFRDLSERPDMQKMAKHIIDGTDIMNRLVTQVLQYSRPVEPELIYTDVTILLKDLVQHMRVDESVGDAIKIKLDAKRLKDPWPLDAQMFKSCLLNLMVNSVLAMPEGGEITLKAWQENHIGILQITDTGVGIKEEHMEKIFSPFFTTRADGTGFGLSEVYKIIQAHAGAVEVESVEEKGTIFTIQIPLKGEL